MKRNVMLVALVVAATLLLASGVVLAKDVACADSASKCVGSERDDFITGSVRDDEIVGRDGADEIFGESFSIFDPAGDDVIRGGKGGDTIEDIFGANVAADHVFGGKGDDFINVKDGDNEDEVDCGPGKDTVLFDDGDVLSTSCETLNP